MMSKIFVLALVLVASVSAIDTVKKNHLRADQQRLEVRAPCGALMTQVWPASGTRTDAVMPSLAKLHTVGQKRMIKNDMNFLEAAWKLIHNQPGHATIDAIKSRFVAAGSPEEVNISGKKRTDAMGGDLKGAFKEVFAITSDNTTGAAKL
eukprot:CAMPEP_0185614476 /NCGR_PEP_ID=MMETSP0436-20130131/31811_1 /TAXON_ID=626734 ORGANISM="Favella taraikaensis, Strain Fe Narragansett Bay" /NCGR_SAMPLE_ID=MMETSP0436 /ASSEMBLY_ACC=CAM_ASM_000390 /LENGTH=149 /DNA_ID=CAMNT_0028249339 /DNA_START=9 /DNA_END=455 /DNA_ORIENTATION=-